MTDTTVSSVELTQESVAAYLSGLDDLIDVEYWLDGDLPLLPEEVGP